MEIETEKKMRKRCEKYERNEDSVAEWWRILI